MSRCSVDTDSGTRYDPCLDRAAARLASQGPFLKVEHLEPGPQRRCRAPRRAAVRRYKLDSPFAWPSNNVGARAV